METLSTLTDAINDIIQDDAYLAKYTKKINEAVNSIAAGIIMPNRSISPPLPDLVDYDTVITSTQAYVSLPSDYQRNVFLVCDSSGNRISPTSDGNYYAYNLFLRGLSDLRLEEKGQVYCVAIKGTRLYYQGIPATPETIGLHFYRKPTDMALDGDSPDGIPEHLQMKLIKSYVCKGIYGEHLEDGQDNMGTGYKIHNSIFNEAMAELCAFIGIDEGPSYYGSDDYY